MEWDDQLKSFRFSMVLGMAFAVTAGILAWQDVPRAAALLAIAGGVVLGAGALKPEALSPLERAWEIGGRALAEVREGAVGGILRTVKAISRVASGGRQAEENGR